MTNKLFLSVIIPCYNELENLKRNVLSDVEKYLNKQIFSWEVIISDDASTDGSFELVEKQIGNNPNFRHLKNAKGGKAFALKSGVEAARGEYVLFSDMDQSTPLAEFEKFKQYLSTGADIVIGSRGYKRENFPLIRKIGSPIFLTFRRLVILPGVRDTQCGFKCFRTNVAREVFKKLQIFKRERGSGWRVGAWDVELLFVANKIKYKINEVTVSWRNEDTSTSKQQQFVKESIEMLREVLRVRTNDILGKYEK
jgi:glycosyltransferase involved in cell wall biosynthesis